MNVMGSLRVFCLVLFALPFAGCSDIMPGTVGWFCEGDEDCDDGLRCVRYNHQGTDHENRLCTGDVLIEDTSKNHGWISVVVSWTLCVIGPMLLVMLVAIGKTLDALRRRRERNP